ncbi:MAG: hypothetical protein FH751_01370 [Firmicutes bacterium]|nr:hypothetical protein [Bacillota bacterium]
MNKKIIIIINIILIGLIFSGCDIFKAKNYNKKEQSLTIEDIELMYQKKGIDIVSIISYNSRDNINYALIETNKVTNNFIWYNLENGDSDILPTGDYQAELKKIQNQNNIIFNIINKNTNKPFILECKRNKEDINSRNDFIPLVNLKDYNTKNTI